MEPSSETKRIQTYREFWPFYLSEHSLRSTKRWHVLGTFLTVTTSVVLVVQGKWLWLPLSAIPGYGCAWYAHFFVQKNHPATFKYPFWSYISDYRMAFWFLRGKYPG